MSTFDQAWQQIQDIRGWFSNPSQAKIMWDSLQQGGHAIEIGSFCGRSTVFLALAIKAAGSSSRVYAVDTFQSSSTELDGVSTMDEFLRNIAHHQVEDFVEIIQGKSQDLQVIQGVPKDAALVYIDANHDYDFVKADIANWRGHVRKGGYLVAHDYYTDGSNQFRGVKRAFDEAFAAGKLRNRQVIPGDSIAFRRGKCGCGGW